MDDESCSSIFSIFGNPTYVHNNRDTSFLLSKELKYWLQSKTLQLVEHVLTILEAMDNVKDIKCDNVEGHNVGL